MIRPSFVESASEIEKVARDVLRGAGVWGVFPTPVDKIAAYSELTIDRRIDLGLLEQATLPGRFSFLSSALRKVLGIIDFRRKTIYLDHTQPANRKNFVKLHEVGHGVLGWQRELHDGYGDDEYTIAPEIQEQFECEANYFASATLFQLEQFDEELRRLPLSFGSVRALAQKFGGSIQAAARRYVASCSKRCALLVLHHPTEELEMFPVKVRNCFESASFLECFGHIQLPEEYDLRCRFVQDIRHKRRLHEDGTVTLDSAHVRALKLDYHFFHNGYYNFVFLFPPGESIRSRVTIREKPRR